jgi:signal transduction histidine kinase
VTPVIRLSASSRRTVSQLLKLGLFLGSSLLVLAVFLFTQNLIGQLSREVASTSRVLARFCALASFPATTDPELQRILSELIAGLDFPIVITDETGHPRAWKQVEVDQALVPAASIDSLVQGLEVAPVIRARYDRVAARVAELDRKNSPIAMTLPGGRVSVGAVHYGEPEVLGRLRWMPFFTVAGVGLLVAIGFGGLALIRQSEKRTIWVGMAKETAHQLGTPLSSLLGWAEILQGHAESAPPGGQVQLPAEELTETVREMSRDLDRLNKVAQRFSHVGSAPKLHAQDVTPVVREVVQYMRLRMPQSPGDAAIEERYAPSPPVRLNPELLDWALENLLSNAISALDKRPGRIEVSVGPHKEGRSVDIVVQDNGRGMSLRDQRWAFEPGYTTKRRGWGLGLALARRVIEEYHGGRLFIRQSAPGAGTTIVIRLRAVKEGGAPPLRVPGA